ncbi:hypothetical protein BH11CYA1_BH11CYA1_38600 [soil metagenome]
MVGSQADTAFDTKYYCILKGAKPLFAFAKTKGMLLAASLVFGLTVCSYAASASEPVECLSGNVQQNTFALDDDNQISPNLEQPESEKNAAHILVHAPFTHRNFPHKNGPSQEMLAAASIVAPSISNFDIVSEGLWRGAAPSNHGMKKLAESGVKTIVDLRLTGQGAAEEASVAKKLGIKYIHLPLGFMGPSLLKVAQFLNIVNEPKNQPVFVHCRYGADRTGALVAVFRVIHDHWSFNQAYSEMRSHHFKPWLASLKRMVARVGDDEAVQKELKILAGKNLATL